MPVIKTWGSCFRSDSNSKRANRAGFWHSSGTARTGRGFGTVLAQPGREGFELFPPIHSPRWMIADVLDGLTPPTTQRFAMRSSPTRAATDGGACGLCGRDLARHRPKLISVASRQIPRFRGWRLVSDTKLVSHRGETWIGRP